MFFFLTGLCFSVSDKSNVHGLSWTVSKGLSSNKKIEYLEIMT